MQKLLQQLREAQERIDWIINRIAEAEVAADRLKDKLDALDDRDTIVGLGVQVNPPENR